MSWVPVLELEALRRDKDERIDKLEREVYRLESILKNWHEVADREVAERLKIKDDENYRCQCKVDALRQELDSLMRDYAEQGREVLSLRRQLEAR